MAAAASLPWRLLDGVPLVTLPCRHVVMVKPEWIDRAGRFLGRLGCTTNGCRRVVDEVRLEGWK